MLEQRSFLTANSRSEITFCYGKGLRKNANHRMKIGSLKASRQKQLLSELISISWPSVE